MTNYHTITIPDSGMEERVDQVLARLLPEYSRTQIKSWIDDGSILMDGKQIKAKTRVVGGEIVTVVATLKQQPDWEAEPIALTVVYEDESVLVINKPAGLVVHPGAGNASHTLLNALLHHAPQLKDLPRAGILHRLDKDTTGLLVIAKTPLALRLLTLQLKERTISREYKAVVYGSMISGNTINAPIDRHHLQRKRMAVVEDGKEAITHYRIAEKFRNHTVLNVKLETGRTHQIRVHMAHIRHPIVGDNVYGKRVQLGKGMSQDMIDYLRRFKRQALHAFALGFEHPVTHEPIRVEAPIPDDMQKLIDLLREDTKGNRD